MITSEMKNDGKDQLVKSCSTLVVHHDVSMTWILKASNWDINSATSPTPFVGVKVVVSILLLFCRLQCDDQNTHLASLTL